jgi:23S rRNA pseudouridine2605 synthase
MDKDKDRRKKKEQEETDQPDDSMRLNKYLAKAGISSRRGAAEIVKKGIVTVNGQIVKDIGYRVQPGDQVMYKGKEIKPETDFIYLLLNKPKDYISTVSDEKGRRTVMSLIGEDLKARVYPVGRLDRATTGLLLLTNDGDLALKLTHPRYKVKKVYHVTLDKPVSETDLEAIIKGVVLDDGPAPVDSAGYVSASGKKEIGMELHVGRNRIIRRIFEHLGYEVKKLDRTYYAGLTKKNLGRGRYRYLTNREVIMLKHFTGK